MFWTFLVVAAIAAAFFQLGATTVWVSVLSLSLKTAVVVAVLIGIASFLWHRSKRY